MSPLRGVAEAATVLDVLQVPLSLPADGFRPGGRRGGAGDQCEKGAVLSPGTCGISSKDESAGNAPSSSRSGGLFRVHNWLRTARADRMRETGTGVFDVTHSLQLPGGSLVLGGSASSSRPAGRLRGRIDALFMEVHPARRSPLRRPEFPAVRRLKRPPGSRSWPSTPGEIPVKESLLAIRNWKKKA